MNKYIRFELIEEKPKTSVYDIINISSDFSIGEIRWYPAWRQYCFFPDENSIWNKDCLRTVFRFIEKLMYQHKNK